MNNNSNLESNNIKFRKIKSLQFLYEISEDGRIFRNVKSKKVYRQYKDNNGNWIISVCIKGKQLTPMIQSLVAECWLDNKPNNYYIEHIDNNLNNNHYKNLRYVIQKENNINKVMCHSISTTITNCNTSEIFKFSTLKDCADYIANNTNKSYNSIHWKLRKRRHHIFGFDIKYII